MFSVVPQWARVALTVRGVGYSGTSGTVGRGEHLTVRSNELFAQPGDASEEASPEKVIGLRHMDSHVGGHMGPNAAQHDLSQHCNGWASTSDQLLVQPAAGASPTLSSERDASDALLGLPPSSPLLSSRVLSLP